MSKTVPDLLRTCTQHCQQHAAGEEAKALDEQLATKRARTIETILVVHKTPVGAACATIVAPEVLP